MLPNCFRSVTRIAESKGMVVISDKINILCISDSMFYVFLFRISKGIFWKTQEGSLYCARFPVWTQAVSGLLRSED